MGKQKSTSDKRGIIIKLEEKRELRTIKMKKEVRRKQLENENNQKLRRMEGILKNNTRKMEETSSERREKARNKREVERI
jgi:hypothetical protein